MDLLPIKIKENKNFCYDEARLLCHWSGHYIGEPRYRFKEHTKEEREKYVCHETIKVYPTGVLVEYDSNCFDVENEMDSYNHDDDDMAFEEATDDCMYPRHTSAHEKRRHYINKMFFNNNGEMVFSQQDYRIFATLIGEELVHLCDSTVSITDKGIGVERENVATEFRQMNSMIGDHHGSGSDIEVDNSHNAVRQEFHTYEDLNEKFRQAKAEKDEQWKRSQEDCAWMKRNEERLSKFGFNNLTLKTPHGQQVYQAYKSYEDLFHTK